MHFSSELRISQVPELNYFDACLLNPFKTRLNALECLNRMLDYLDKMMILEEILPFLTDIQCSDADIIMTVVGSFVFFSCTSLLLPTCVSVIPMHTWGEWLITLVSLLSGILESDAKSRDGICSKSPSIPFRSVGS